MDSAANSCERLRKELEKLQMHPLIQQVLRLPLDEGLPELPTLTIPEMQGASWDLAIRDPQTEENAAAQEHAGAVLAIEGPTTMPEMGPTSAEEAQKKTGAIPKKPSVRIPTRRPHTAPQTPQEAELHHEPAGTSDEEPPVPEGREVTEAAMPPYSDEEEQANARPATTPTETEEPEWQLAIRHEPEHAWSLVYRDLDEARHARRKARVVEAMAFKALEEFLTKYGEEGEQLAGAYPRMMRDEREAQAAKMECLANLHKLRRVAEEEEAAKREIQRFKEETAREAARLQARLVDAQNERLAATGEHPAKLPRCCRCGLEGVKRGRECPNRHNHPEWVTRPQKK